MPTPRQPTAARNRGDPRIAASCTSSPRDDRVSRDPGASTALLPVSSNQLQQTAFDALDSMERKARQLCDDTRCHYDLLLQRQSAQHERQLLALQNKLKEVIGSSLSLNEHRQALGEQTKAHERDLRALVKVHDDEFATFRLRCKQLANEQQLQRSRAFQAEKDFLLDKMTQLEAERTDAIRQWHEQELATLTAQKELHSALETAQSTEAKLHEACQHIVSLKAQLQKADRVTAKLKSERLAHAAARTQWQQELRLATNAQAELSKRVCVLEVETRHAQEDRARMTDDVVGLRNTLAASLQRVSELEQAVAGANAKERATREFQEQQRAQYEDDCREWRESQQRLRDEATQAAQQVGDLEHKKQTAELLIQSLQAEAVQRKSQHEQQVAQLAQHVKALEAKYARAKQRVAALGERCAELQDEERASRLLLAPRRRAPPS